MILSILYLLMILLSGYAVGRLYTNAIGQENKKPLYLLLVGNIILCFIFISLFIGFAVFAAYAHELFVFFTLFILCSFLLSVYYFIKFLKKLINNYLINRDLKKLFFEHFQHTENSLIILCMFVSILAVLVFYGVIIYFHPIFNEYDSLYFFLLNSRSILLGNGLNQDYFGGADITIRSPPFVQSINAWIIDIFDHPTLRLFPVYFIILFSISIYYSARRLIQNDFYAYMAVLLSLITPALLVVSSRFSLQQDLPFMAFLTFALLVFTKVISSSRWKNYDIISFIISLSLLALTREIGLIISWSLLIILIAYKFTNNKNIKGFFLILVFIPLYFLSFFDLYNNGITTLILLRIITLIIANIILFVIAPRIMDYPKLVSLRNPLLSFLVLVIPLSFILGNILVINGLYPTLLFSTDFASSVQEYRKVFDLPNKLIQDLSENFSQIPRIDLFFISSALGTVFIFFKFYGFKVIIQGLQKGKKNYFPLILFLLILVVVWSYLLTSNFTEAGIRHISYFVPFLALTIIIGFDTRSILIKLYLLTFIVFSFYYFMNYDIETTSQFERFYALWIDPFKSELIDIMDLVVGASFFIGFIVLRKFEHLIDRNPFQKYFVLGFPIMVFVFLLCLLTINIQIPSFELNDSKYNSAWENNVFQVINYLRIADSGNVLSVRAPAISYFTNRTNYDIFNPHVFNKIGQPIFNSPNTSSIEDKLDKLDIKYIVFPNIYNPSYNIVKNIEEHYKIQEKLKSSNRLMEVPLENFTIYKVNDNRSMFIDLLQGNSDWKSINVNLLNFDNTLLILSETNNTEYQYNRIFMNTHLPIEDRPTLLKLKYASDIIYGDASMFYEIRDVPKQEILHSAYLGNTFGENNEKFLLLPAEIAGKEIEMRFYIVSNEPGKYYLKIDEAYLTYP